VATLISQCLSSDHRLRPTAKDVAVQLRTIVNQCKAKGHHGPSKRSSSDLSTLTFLRKESSNSFRGSTATTSLKVNADKVTVLPRIDPLSKAGHVRDHPCGSPVSVLARQQYSTSTSRSSVSAPVEGPHVGRIAAIGTDDEALHKQSESPVADKLAGRSRFYRMNPCCPPDSWTKDVG
jgi:hypothetical protein